MVLGQKKEWYQYRRNGIRTEEGMVQDRGRNNTGQKEEQYRTEEGMVQDRGRNGTRTEEGTVPGCTRL